MDWAKALNDEEAELVKIRNLMCADFSSWQKNPSILGFPLAEMSLLYPNILLFSFS